MELCGKNLLEHLGTCLLTYQASHKVTLEAERRHQALSLSRNADSESARIVLSSKQLGSTAPYSQYLHNKHRQTHKQGQGFGKLVAHPPPNFSGSTPRGAMHLIYSNAHSSVFSFRSYLVLILRGVWERKSTKFRHYLILIKERILFPFHIITSFRSKRNIYNTQSIYNQKLIK